MIPSNSGWPRQARKSFSADASITETDITSLELLKNGSFEAEVEGSDDDYNVSVEVNPKTNKIVRCYCDCPYDYGDICKHIAAVLPAIR